VGPAPVQIIESAVAAAFERLAGHMDGSRPLAQTAERPADEVLALAVEPASLDKVDAQREGPEQRLLAGVDGGPCAARSRPR
jgi:hypothetical protein